MREPYRNSREPMESAHFCERTGSTVYCDVLDCPYCDRDKADASDQEER
jgi:hypothetical protein